MRRACLEGQQQVADTLISPRPSPNNRAKHVLCTSGFRASSRWKPYKPSNLWFPFRGRKPGFLPSFPHSLLTTSKWFSRLGSCPFGTKDEPLSLLPAPPSGRSASARSRTSSCLCKCPGKHEHMCPVVKSIPLKTRTMYYGWPICFEEQSWEGVQV